MTGPERPTRSQVTTRRGDKGRTTALSGERFAKSHPLVECVGAVDELRAHTARVRLRIIEEKPRDHEAASAFLHWLLHVYFVMGAECSDPLNKRPAYHRGYVGEGHLKRLEAQQAKWEEGVTLPPAFIVSASTPLAAEIDVLATVARRFERSLVRLTEAIPEWQPEALLRFANRLSDCLFILARYVEDGNHIPVDYSVLEP